MKPTPEAVVDEVAVAPFGRLPAVHLHRVRLAHLPVARRVQVPPVHPIALPTVAHLTHLATDREQSLLLLQGLLQPPMKRLIQPVREKCFWLLF